MSVANKYDPTAEDSDGDRLVQKWCTHHAIERNHWLVLIYG